MRLISNRGLTILLAVFVMIQAGVGAVAAASVDEPTQLNHDADSVPSPKIITDVEKDVHRVGEWKATQYEGDNGNVQTLPAHLNNSDKNPVTLTATEINESDFTQFPRKSSEGDNQASWTDASEWTTTGSAISVSETTTAPNVEGLTVSTSGLASANYTEYNNFSVTSDEAKRHIQLAANVNTLESSAHVEIRIVDADGDYKTVLVDPDNSTDTANVLANATGNGYVIQQQLGTLSTTTVSGSDGTFDDIEAINVSVSGADASISFSLVNSEKMGQYKFGEQAYDDSDDDDTKDDTRSVYEPTGSYEVTAINTLGNTFSDATVRNVQLSMIFAASDLTKDMDAQANFTKATNYPSFEWLGTYNYRLQLPSAYDLSYSNAKLVITTRLPDSRYQTMQIAEGVSDSAFDDISSWTDVLGSIDKGEQVVLDSTIQPGQQIAFESEVLLTPQDKKSALATGAVGQFTQKSNGGLLSQIISIPGAIFGTILALLGLGKASGG